ncbi:MAG: hypothetical protein H0U70_03345 [Tatlockia sp.]|nr:hypothetical protein [Tatlockia sp.]
MEFLDVINGNQPIKIRAYIHDHYGQLKNNIDLLCKGYELVKERYNMEAIEIFHNYFPTLGFLNVIKGNRPIEIRAYIHEHHDLLINHMELLCKSYALVKERYNMEAIEIFLNYFPTRFKLSKSETLRFALARPEWKNPEELLSQESFFYQGILFDLISYGGSSELVALLLSKHTPVRVQQMLDYQPHNTILIYGTPLHLAADMGDYKIVELLVKEKMVNINAKNANNHTALSLITSILNPGFVYDEDYLSSTKKENYKKICNLLRSIPGIELPIKLVEKPKPRVVIEKAKPDIVKDAAVVISQNPAFSVITPEPKIVEPSFKENQFDSKVDKNALEATGNQFTGESNDTERLFKMKQVGELPPTKIGLTNQVLEEVEKTNEPFDISMLVLDAFITALGITAVVLAFTVLNAATFGGAGVFILAGIGTGVALLGLGFFGKHAYEGYKGLQCSDEEPSADKNFLP